MNDIYAIIFDLDGVICSTDRYHYLAWKALADRLQIPFDEQVNQKLRGVSRMESLAIILGDRCNSYTGEEKQALAEEKNEIYRAYLSEIVSACPPEFALRPIDEQIFRQSRETAWMRDWTSAYADYDEYQRLGFGVVLEKDGEIVAGASAYSRYREGIEIQIDTYEPYRRRGLALICGAKLILDCLEKGLYPSWDAANLGSVALAEKLGYHFDREYVAYGIQNY